MAKSKKVVAEKPADMGIEFSFPAHRAEELAVLLLDLGWIATLQSLQVVNEKTGKLEPFPYDEDVFWEAYNDPDRPHFTEEVLGQLIEVKKLEEAASQ